MTKDEQIQHLKDEVADLKKLLEERALAMMALRSDQVIMNEILWLMTKGTFVMKALHADRSLKFDFQWIPAQWTRNDPPTLHAQVQHSYKAIRESIDPAKFTKHMIRQVICKVIQEGMPLWAENEIRITQRPFGEFTS